MRNDHVIVACNFIDVDTGTMFSKKGEVLIDNSVQL